MKITIYCFQRQIFGKQMMIMRLALAQMKMSENLLVNLSQTVGLIHNASEQGIDLVYFPEVQLTPFFPQFEKKDVRNWVLHEDDDIVQTVWSI